MKITLEKNWHNNTQLQPSYSVLVRSLLPLHNRYAVALRRDDVHKFRRILTNYLKPNEF